MKENVYFIKVAKKLDYFFSGILDIKMYPYGNAHEKKLPDGHYAYECQHGDVECQGNFIEACIQKETNFNANFYFPVLECMESADRIHILDIGKQCLELFVPNSNWNLVMECAHVCNEHLGHNYLSKSRKIPCFQ